MGQYLRREGKARHMVNGWKDKAEKVVKNNDWNDVEIRCEGTTSRSGSMVS